MLSRDRLVPLVGSAVFGVATVVATSLSPGQGWVQAYGPNMATTFFGVTLALAGVQYFLDREEARRRAPAERAAVLHGYDVYFHLAVMVSNAVQSFAVDAGNTHTSLTRQELADTFVRYVEAGASFEVPSMLDSTSVAEFMSGRVTLAMEAYDKYGAEIMAVAPARLAAATQRLMQGDGSSFLRFFRHGFLIGGFRPESGGIPDLRNFASALVGMSDALQAAGGPG